MRLTITRQEAGQLQYESLLVWAKPQRRLDILDPNQRRSNSFLTMCSCCTRALLEPVGWLDVEEVSVRLRLFETRKVPEMRYTVCPECVASTESDNGTAA